MKIYFYRYGDDWCTEYIDKCTSTWERLNGIKISVGVAGQGDSSLIGRFKKYTLVVLRY